MLAPRTSFRFGLSPSLGLHRTHQLARRLEEALALAVALPVQVTVAGSYEHLEAMLLGGSLEAAWVNPLLLARMRGAGAEACLRGIRHGSTSFRSALVVRRGEVDGPEDLRGRRAAWTDPESLAGYRLPLHFLRSRGLHPERLFPSERFTFSYPTALGRLLDGSADVAPCFVHRGDAEALEGVLRLLVGSEASRLEPLAFTEPVPNDGLVFAPHLPAAVAEELSSRVEEVLHDSAGRAVLELLDVEQVVRADSLVDEPIGWLAAV
ncbi:phosphate/phosphite/phosphonate ABC transporter substrate-binding protein [Vulgatibacter sp.]|uniref:phosphate/phosphite/phosphonate ABC transporter substrate-binding protein n=1 Tax=Vulgatibacter sp. TaxID=1971226 RepID=UPI00356B5BCC